MSWPVVAVTVLAGALRFTTLDLQSYWYDEVSTVLVLEQPGLGSMLGEVSASESNPPLYYVLAWIWSQPFGTGEVGLRFLSALAGTATVPVVYWIGARLASARVGLLAAALIAVHPILIWYSQEARNYALLVLLAAVSIALLVEALKDPAWRWVGGWAAASALAVATHYFALYLVAAEAIVLLALCREPRRAWLAIGMVAAVVAALLPVALDQIDARNAWIGDEDLSPRVEEAAVIGAAGDRTAPLIAAPAALILAGLALAFMGDRRERAAAQLGGWLLVAAGLVPLALAAIGVDYFLYRNALPALIPLFVVVAIGLGSRRAGWLGAAAVAGLCIYFVAVAAERNLNPLRQRKHYRDVAAIIGEPSRSRLITLPPLAARPVHYYLDSVENVERPTQVREVIIVRDASSDPPPPPVPSEFRREAWEEVGQFEVTTLVAPRPATLRPSRLCCELGGERTVLVQSPPAIAGRMTTVSESETVVARPSRTRTSSSFR